MCKVSLLLSFIVLNGCALLQSQVEINSADRVMETSSWRVEAEGSFSTQIFGRDVPTSDTQIALRGELRESPRSLNPDDTETWLLEYRGFLQGENADNLGPSDLTGRALTIRRFPGKPVLEIGGGSHLLGFAENDEQSVETQRLGDVFDLLLAVVNPAAPALDVNEVRLKMIRWPFSAERGRNLRSYANVTWAHVAREDGLIRMSYRGGISGQGRDTSWNAEIAVSGEASGEVWLDEITGEVRAHEFDWVRVLDYRFSNTDGRISQRQQFTGEAQWLD
jgi:hypothetical protein